MNDNTHSSNDATRKPPKRPKLERSLKLPTPPPDPWENTHPAYPKTPHPSKDESNTEKTDDKEKEKTERSSSGVSDKDREMFDYIESLHKSVYSRSSSSFAPAIVTEEAFDHLEKLYKLMEQMLELREQNVKLHRRIRDLEHLNNLEKFTLNPEAVEEEYPDLEKDTAFAEAILESILQDPKNKDLPKYKNLKTSLLKRHRSGSASEKQAAEVASVAEKVEKEEREKEKERMEGANKSEKQSKVSKWTKVKAAFRWEKASNVGETKSQDSGIHVPVNYEIARYLRVPSTSDDVGHSPGDSGAGISTPGTISSASSNDDLRMSRQACEDFRSSDDENPHHYIPHSKDGRQKSHSHKYHRTPWAKMKDIIHTRNSLRKKHRLSAASDDIQIDVEFCSENEDVFEPDDSANKSTNVSFTPSPNAYTNSSGSPCGSEIPPEVFERYQRALAEDSTSDSETKPSKWNRVRKAFLTREHTHHHHHHHHHHQHGTKISQETHSSAKSEEANAEEEIRRNYKKLQKKLSLEFQEKINEWERLKQNSPGVSNSPSACGYVEDNRDPFYIKKMEELQKIKHHSPTGKHRCIQMTREYDLPPDFKKKLQEWEKIKKTSGSGGSRKKLGEITKWKSLGGPRSSDHSPVFEYPAMSDEFRKKLEEWRQIKASGGPTAYADQKKLKDKTPSPKLSRKNSSPKQSKKGKDPDRELHWFEKELGKIEKEKHRLERERQKFIEREERLSKLRRSMLGAPPKKEILIHTPSGFHRFEGISRKFTQKLYEWEKSQGIAPEASTFALLSSSSYAPEIRDNGGTSKDNSVHHTTSLPRSKSADSIAISALNLTCPLLSGHPSSLSLNDMDDLEKECLADSKSSSMQYLLAGEESYLDDNLDADEPEAVLVEVEDYEEETAEPLHVSCVERQQLPVYQRQEFKSLCESETIVVPKIRRSESARAQINYDLIENIVKLLTEVQVTEDEIRCLVENKNIQEEQNKKTLKFLNELQNQSVKKLIDKLLKLQEANKVVANNIVKNDNQAHSNLDTIVDNVQDTSNEMLQLTEHMTKTISSRFSGECHSVKTTIFEQIKDIRSRIAELRRHLSYICAATDLTTPSRKTSTGTKLEVTKTVSSESRDSKGDTSDFSRKGSDRERRFVKMEGKAKLSASQGAVKKRIRYRQKTANKSLVDTDDEEEPETETQKSIRPHKKLTRTRSVSEGNMSPPKFDSNLLAPTVQESHSSDPRLEISPTDSAVTLFVKTTRKLFTPIVETSLAKSFTEPDISLKIQDKLKGQNTQLREQNTELNQHVDKKEHGHQKTENLASLPPLPSSPVPQRKVYKELSPSIKLLMAKYNQNVEQISGIKSGGSSGSNSPIAWRSPVSERRVKVQTEKYQEELKKMSPLMGERIPIQKSSSVSLLSSQSKEVVAPVRKASLNTTTLQSNCQGPDKYISIKNTDEMKRNLKVDISLANKNTEAQNDGEFSPEVRMRKIQKAKEDFLKAPVSAPSYLSEEVLQFPQRNRLSQISVENESSNGHSTLPGSLIKSASAGMINVDADVYNRINPEYRAEGYVSLPRQTKKSKDGILGGKSAFSTIASKFRKVKMRKGKDKDKDKDKDKQAVATLCRQSLLVDINNEHGENSFLGPSGDTYSNNNGDLQRNDSERRANREESTPLSPPVFKSNSWLRRSLFKR